MSHRNRRAGHDYERAVVRELKGLGFDDVLTARSESRNKDNKGIDVFGESFPFYIQCKATKDKPNYPKIISEIKQADNEKPIVLFHKFVEKSKKNFITKGEYAIMEKELFYKLIKLLKMSPSE